AISTTGSATAVTESILSIAGLPFFSDGGTHPAGPWAETYSVHVTARLSHPVMSCCVCYLKAGGVRQKTPLIAIYHSRASRQICRSIKKLFAPALQLKSITTFGKQGV